MDKQWKSRGFCHVFGSNVVHDNGMIDFELVISRQTDPEVIKPHLFAALDPEFASRVKPGDFIVAGPGFGGGKAHTTAYIAMAALDLRVLCEGSFERVLLGAANLGLPMMDRCAGLASEVVAGEELEVDMLAGTVTRLAVGKTLTYPPIRPDVRQTIETGGREGLLRSWIAEHPEMSKPLEA